MGAFGTQFRRHFTVSHMVLHCTINQEFHLSCVSLCSLEYVSVPHKSVWWIVVFAQISTMFFPKGMSDNLARSL